MIAKLGDLGLAKIGLTYKPNDVRQSGALVLRSSNIKDNRIDYHDTVYVDPSVIGDSVVAEGDILLCARNGSRDLIGKSALINGQAAGSAFGAFMSIFRSPENDILQYHFQHTIIAKQVQAHLGATINQITNRSLKGFRVPLPEALGERRAIAEALGDVDALIGALDALIAKKRDVKRGAMQRLLTGATRLPGFSEPWRQVRIGDICDFLRTGVASRADLAANAGVGYIHYGDIHASVASTWDLRHHTLPEISPAKVARLPRLRDGDIVMADASEDYEGIGKAVEVSGIGDRDVVAGLHTILMRTRENQLAVGFGGYLQFLAEIRRAIVRIANGTSVYGISSKGVAAIEISLPLFDEQRAIAAVLSDMDAEIEALGARRAKTADVKKGMMRDLLTGRVRLSGTGEKRAMEAAE